MTTKLPRLLLNWVEVNRLTMMRHQAVDLSSCALFTVSWVRRSASVVSSHVSVIIDLNGVSITWDNVRLGPARRVRKEKYPTWAQFVDVYNRRANAIAYERDKRVDANRRAKGKPSLYDDVGDLEGW